MKPPDDATRRWLRQVLVSVVAAVAAGLLAYLAARGALGALLLVQAQDLLRDVAGALGGGIEGLPGADLRAARQRIAALDAQYAQVSAAIGFVAAAAGAVASYLWQEMRRSGGTGAI